MTLDQAQTRLDAALAALDKAQGADAGGIQSSSVEGRSASFRSLEELQNAVSYWLRIVNQLTAKAQGAKSGISIARWNY